MTRASRLVLAAAAVVAALAVLLALAGADPVAALRAGAVGVAGDRYALGEVLVVAAPLALIGLSLLPALRAGVFTVGSEGQLVLGAMTGTAAALALPAHPWSLAAAALAGVAGGALWALAPALARARLGTNEILSTLLLNVVAGLLLLMALKGPLASGAATATPRSARLPEELRLPLLLEGTRLHAGAIVVPLALALALLWVRTPGALRLALGASHPDLAARLGLRPARAVLGPMLLAGGAAGLAGTIQVAGLTHTLYPSVGGGLGFSGLLVAFLGALTPLGTVLAALAMGALLAAANGMQVGTGVPASIAVVAQGLVLLVLAWLGGRARRRAP